MRSPAPRLGFGESVDVVRGRAAKFHALVEVGEPRRRPLMHQLVQLAADDAGEDGILVGGIENCLHIHGLARKALRLGGEPEAEEVDRKFSKIEMN
jgi:hypothetical protein